MSRSGSLAGEKRLALSAPAGPRPCAARRRSPAPSAPTAGSCAPGGAPARAPPRPAAPSRAWTLSLPEGHGGWLGALRDRPVGAALAHIHRSPERSWTNASLAEAVGMSRSRFAARFTALVGEPPLTYLSRWRLEAAASLLQDGVLGLGEIAARVGYDSEAAFSRAFRRRFGSPPGAYRRRSAA